MMTDMKTMAYEMMKKRNKLFVPEKVGNFS